jgi:predicted amidohydrolase YtcJ
MNMLRNVVRAGSLLLAGLPALAAEVESAPVDRAYVNGFVFTADARGTIAQALAIRSGKIVYVGDEAGLAPFLGPGSVRVDLAGRFLMPGLVDGHMHPVEAGSTLLKCSLH